MPHSLKRKLADSLSGKDGLNRKALQISRSLKEVERMINSPKSANTKRKK